MVKNDQEIANELNTFFKDTASNLEILHDIFDPVEKCINKYKFHPSKLFTKNRIKIQNLFSFCAIERNDMIRELDPRKATVGISIPFKAVKLSGDISVDIL